MSRRLASEEREASKDEQQLRQLAGGVEATQRTASAINDEVRAQSVLLDDVEAGLSRTREEMMEARARAMALDRDPYSMKNFCALLMPVVLLFVMFLLLIHRVLVA